MILLDEVEKADPDVMNVFYQIFDKGVANDGEGREINFRNTLILMTSNLASERIASFCTAGQRPAAEDLELAIRPQLSQHFRRPSSGACVWCPTTRSSAKCSTSWSRLLARFGERLQRRQLQFSHCPALVTHLAERCGDSNSGARLIDHLIESSTCNRWWWTACSMPWPVASRCSGYMPRWMATVRWSVSSPEMSAMFNQVPQPLRYAEALLGRFAGLARAANADSLLGGLVETAAQLSNCQLSQLYLLDATHTRLTLCAEWHNGLLQPREATSLPSDYDGEQLLQYCLCQNQTLCLSELDSSLHASGFLPDSPKSWRSLLCLPLQDEQQRVAGLLLTASTESRELHGFSGSLAQLGAFGPPSCICSSACARPAAPRQLPRQSVPTPAVTASSATARACARSTN